MADDNSEKNAQIKHWFAELFGRAAPTYDQVGPKFFGYFGRRLVELAQVSTGARVLDVATGRGAILFPAAEAVGPRGFVTGIDISEAMVHETSAEIQQRGLGNIEVLSMDAENLEFPNATFDYALCGLSIFIFPQHDRALSEMHRVMKSGAVVGVTTFWRDDERWKWLGELFEKYLPATPEADSPTEEDPTEPDFRSHQGMHTVMSAAGFSNIQIREDEPDFVYASEEDWWSTVWSHGMRSTLEKIERTSGRDALQQFKLDAIEKLQSVKQADGFHHMWSVLYTLGTKP